jgi:gliding motility-associated-like protein
LKDSNENKLQNPAFSFSMAFSCLFFIFSFQFSFTQAPTSCFEITSILVDGCDGGNEGKNEMFGFHVGPNPINVNDLRVDGAGANGLVQLGKWPNTANNFRGFCTDPQATANLQVLNDAILQCGQLIEPPGGIIPAEAKVIVFTSTDFTPITSYFENLTETLYVIFQCVGNTNGHFANYNATASTRTLVLTHLPTNCFDQVSYDVSNLITVAGIPGGQDGGAVAYDFDGNPTYFNNGCQAPFIPTEITINVPTEICIESVLDLSASITGDYVSLTWSGGNGFFSSVNELNTQYTTTSSDLGSLALTLTAVDPCGAIIQETVTIQVIQTPVLTITSSGPTTFCEGGSVTLTASGGSNLTWSTMQSGNSITVNSTDSYDVFSTNACGTGTETIFVTVNPSPIVQISASNSSICAGQSVVLTASGATSYLWSNGLGENAQVTTSPASTSIFTVQGTSNGCTSNQTVTITVNQLPTVNAGQDVSACFGQSITLAASGASTYSWNNGLGSGASHSFVPTVSSTYTVVGTDANGCQSSDEVTVNLFQLPSISAGNDAVICAGQTTQLTASGGVSYLWSNNLGEGVSHSVSPQVTTNYSVTGVDANGCSNTDEVVITVNALPQVSGGSDQTVCQGETVVVNASGAQSYVWTGISSTNSTASFTAVNSVNLSVTGTDANGCSNTDNVSITVNNLPTLEAGEGQTLCLGDSVLLNANSNASSLTWSTGNENNSYYTPISSELITVTAILNSCTSSAQLELIVVDCLWDLVLPNVVTPNADNVNDFFEPVLIKNIILNEVVFINRWGNEVYSWKNEPTLKWNLKDNAGNDLHEGTYFYKVDFTDNQGKMYTKHGFFQLIKK